MARKLRINYYVEPDREALARRTAQYLVEMAAEAVDARGQVRIAVSGGSTPKAAFQLLADPHQRFRAADAVGPAGSLLGGRALCSAR